MSKYQLAKKLVEQERLIKIMGKYFELIIDIGYDYDGYGNSLEGCKGLIDELIRYASLGRAGNTTEVMYVNGEKKYNILHELLKKEGE